jgi:23S rRNA (cytosine1962-C5)-methyltransferase
MDTIPPRFLQYLKQAVQKREQLFEQLSDEKTNCYRVFHGAVEGWPGLTIDRYGSILLFQTWRMNLRDDVVEQMANYIEEQLQENFYLLWCDRTKRGKVQRHSIGDMPDIHFGMELGLRFVVDPIHRGIDPLLFLDFRAGRRKIMEEAQGKSLLNLFAYTCGIGVAALYGGAKDVLNVDFSRYGLDVGIRNSIANAQSAKKFQTIKEDAIAVMRQFSGLGIRGRARRRPHTKLQPRIFDIVVLDPPRLASSPFGKVDTVNDYQSLFKPALLCTKPGGNMLVTNNVASVDMDQWKLTLHRCAEKASRPLRRFEVISPEGDFPTLDGKSPLKMAWLSV